MQVDGERLPGKGGSPKTLRQSNALVDARFRAVGVMRAPVLAHLIIDVHAADNSAAPKLVEGPCPIMTGAATTKTTASSNRAGRRGRHRRRVASLGNSSAKSLNGLSHMFYRLRDARSRKFTAHDQTYHKDGRQQAPGDTCVIAEVFMVHGNLYAPSLCPVSRAKSKSGCHEVGSARPGLRQSRHGPGLSKHR